MNETRYRAIVIGVSAGAIDALSTLLPALREPFLLPIVIVVHLPPEKKSLLASLFQANCPLRVVECEDKQPLEAGTVYFAPPDYHVLMESDLRLSLSTEAPVHFSRPSVDVLFESAAEALGSGVIGIVLTGANWDGAQGLKAIEDAGGEAIVQLLEEAQEETMPRTALKQCPNARVLSLLEIAAYLNSIGNSSGAQL